MTIVFRCDANNKVGLGHLNRCIPIAKYLPSPFFIGKFNSTAENLLKTANLNYKKDDHSVSFHRISLKLKDIKLVFFDSYELDHDRFLKESLHYPFPWGCLDDANTSKHPNANFVVNFRAGAEEFAKYDSQKQFLGLEYLPLVDGFIQLRKKHLNRDHSKIKNILIFVGGEDIYNKGKALVQGALSALPKARITYISNTPFHHTNVQNKSISSQFTKYLNDIDLCITGGGKVKYEIAFTGIPVISYAQTDLQNEDSIILEDKNIIFRGSMIKEIDADSVSHDLIEFKNDIKIRESLKEATKKLFTDNPTEYLAKNILNSI